MLNILNTSTKISNVLGEILGSTDNKSFRALSYKTT